MSWNIEVITRLDNAWRDLLRLYIDVGAWSKLDGDDEGKAMQHYLILGLDHPVHEGCVPKGFSITSGICETVRWLYKGCDLHVSFFIFLHWHSISISPSQILLILSLLSLVICHIHFYWILIVLLIWSLLIHWKSVRCHTL